jgi:hypothetical protein
MTIGVDEYDTMRAWSALMLEKRWQMPKELEPESHPIACLDQIAASSPARARQGLSMMIGDLIEESSAVSGDEIRQLDELFRQAKLPTLSDVRLRFHRGIKRILKSGEIKSEVDYYAVRNVVEGLSDDTERTQVWDLLAAYEGSIKPRDASTPPA